MERRPGCLLGLVVALLVTGLACNAVRPQPTATPPAIAELVTEPPTAVPVLEATETAVPTEVPEPEPTSTPEPEPTVAPAETPVAAQGLCAEPDIVAGDLGFCFDPALADGVLQEVLPAGEEEVLFAEMWSFPERARVEFQGLSHPAGDVATGSMVIYPTADLEAGSPEAADILDEIRGLITTQPAADAIEHIRVLPPVPAGQVFRAHVAYLEGNGVLGVRFLTMYGHDVSPITNDRVTYVFQGFAADGAYFVTVWFPVAHDSLRDSHADYSEDEMAAIYNDFGPYVNEAVADLSAQPADSFEPDLTLLDAMIRSLHVR